MIQTIGLNFKGNLKYKSEKYKCPDYLAMTVSDLQSVSSSHSSDSFPQATTPAIPLVTTSQVEEDSQEHLQFSCRANQDLRESRDMNETGEILAFFRDVVQRRVQLQRG